MLSLQVSRDNKMAKKPKWRKILYEDQNVADHYVDESFLDELRKNRNINSSSNHLFSCCYLWVSQITRAGPEIFAKGHPLFLVLSSEFLETPNQAYFYANFWFCTRTFPAGDSNLRQFFFLLTRLKLLNTWRQQRESKFGFRHKRSEDRRRVCHRPFSVGVIWFSSRPIRTSHSNCVFIDSTIIMPMQIWEARDRLV